MKRTLRQRLAGFQRHGAGDLVALKLGNPVFAIARRVAQFVEAEIEAIADQPAFLDRQRGFLDDGAGDQFDKVRRVGKLRGQFVDEFRAGRRLLLEGGQRRGGTGRLQAGQKLFEGGNFFQTPPQGQQIASVARTGGEPAKRSFEVSHLGQFAPEIIQQRRVVEPGPDGVEAARDGGGGGQRLAEPVAQPAGAHRGDRAVERAVEAGLARRVGGARFEDFQIAQGDRIQRHEIRALIEGQACQGRDVAPQMLCQVMNHRSRRPHRRRAVLQPKTVQRGHFEMLPHCKLRGLRGEDPVLVRIQNRGLPSGDRGQGRGGGQAEGFAAGAEGGQEIIPFRGQEAFVEVRSRTEDLRDLPLDQLAGPRLLHLVADGHFAPRLQEPGDVAVGGVKGNAAHGDVAAVRQRHVEQGRAGPGVVKKHLIEIPKAEQQEGFARQFALDAAILRHHRRQLCILAQAFPV